MKSMFSDDELSSELGPQIDQMRVAIATARYEELEDRKPWLDVYGAVPVVIDEEGITTTHTDEDVVSFIVPFVGTAELMKYRPKGASHNFPEGEVGLDEICFTYELGPLLPAALLKDTFEQDLDVFVQWLGWSKQEVDEFNLELERVLELALAERGPSSPPMKQ